MWIPQEQVAGRRPLENELSTSPNEQLGVYSRTMPEISGFAFRALFATEPVNVMITLNLLRSISSPSMQYF